MALTPAPFDLRTLPGLEPVLAWPPAPPPRPCLHGFPAGPVAVQVLVLPPDPEPWIALLEPAASDDRRARSARFRFRADALRCLAAEALLRHALAELHGLPAAAIALETSPEGKPRLAGRPDIHFNLSHSGPWILCAVNEGPVGIDVEEVRPRDPLPAESVMTPEELRHFQGLPPLAAREFFYRLWTLKESLLKAMGTGLGLDPRGIRLDFSGPGITAAHATRPAAHWRLLELPLPGAAKAAICF
jgi:phosphopantetheinyl transferase